MKRSEPTYSVEQARLDLESLFKGSLSEAEREDVERSFFENDAHFEALLTAESEIIDDLALGDLPGDKATLLCQKLELVPHLDKRVQATRLLKHLAEERMRKQPEKSSLVPALLGRWIGAAASNSPRTVVGIAAIVILFAGWFLSQYGFGLSSHKRSPEMAVLSTSTVRGGSDIPSVRASGDSLYLLLELDRRENQATGWSARLQTPQGSTIDISRKMAVRSFTWGQAVEVEIDLTDLISGVYRVDLHSTNAIEQGLVLEANYRFRLDID